jgi:hypothetical protein
MERDRLTKYIAPDILRQAALVSMLQATEKPDRLIVGHIPVELYVIATMGERPVAAFDIASVVLQIEYVVNLLERSDARPIPGGPV